MRYLLIILVLLSACAEKAHPVTTVTQLVYVDKPVACPPAAERERLRKLRPDALRNQSMPPTAVERNAKAQAQLGKYEAEGGYSDQVEAALDRCQTP